MLEVLNSRSNGNAKITLYNDGTREIYWPTGELDLEYPLSIDLNISNRCDNNCQFCYQNCSKGGKQADLLNLDYLKELPSGTEIAINIQRPLNYDLEEFLKNMKDIGIIINCTINQNHLEDMYIKSNLIQWQRSGLIYGIGVSATSIESLVKDCEGLNNINIHMINGIHSIEDVLKVSQNFKVLILGYKMVGRGPVAKLEDPTIEKNIHEMNLRVKDLIKKVHYEIAFDNLALEQINIRDYVSTEQWDESYQGDDGSISFYINAVNRTYALNSLVSQDKMKPIGNKTLKQIFKEMKENAKKIL